MNPARLLLTPRMYLGVSMKLLRTLALAMGLSFVAQGAATAAPKKAAPTKKKADTKGSTKKGDEKEEDDRRPKAQFRELPKLEDAEREALADKKREESIANLLKIVDK